VVCVCGALTGCGGAGGVVLSSQKDLSTQELQ